MASRYCGSLGEGGGGARGVHVPQKLLKRPNVLSLLGGGLTWVPETPLASIPHPKTPGNSGRTSRCLCLLLLVEAGVLLGTGLGINQSSAMDLARMDFGSLGRLPEALWCNWVSSLYLNRDRSSIRFYFLISPQHQGAFSPRELFLAPFSFGAKESRLRLRRGFTTPGSSSLWMVLFSIYKGTLPACRCGQPRRLTIFQKLHSAYRGTTKGNNARAEMIRKGLGIL